MKNVNGLMANPEAGAATAVGDVGAPATAVGDDGTLG